MYYNSDWKCLSYLVSSKETAFSMKLMELFDAQILISQLMCRFIQLYICTHAKGEIKCHSKCIVVTCLFIVCTICDLWWTMYIPVGMVVCIYFCDRVLNNATGLVLIRFVALCI